MSLDLTDDKLWNIGSANGLVPAGSEPLSGNGLVPAGIT